MKITVSLTENEAEELLALSDYFGEEEGAVFKSLLKKLCVAVLQAVEQRKGEGEAMTLQEFINNGSPTC